MATTKKPAAKTDRPKKAAAAKAPAKKAARPAAKRAAPRKKKAPEADAAPALPPKPAQAQPAPLPPAPPPTGVAHAASPTPPAPPVELLGLQQMASLLRLHPLQLKLMVQAGQVPGVKVEGEWRFNKDLVQEALRRRSQGR